MPTTAVEKDIMLGIVKDQRVQDSKYFMEQMFAGAKQIQLADNTSDAGPSYDSAFISNSEISLNVRDTEDTLDDASKSQQKVYEQMNDPIAVANKQNCWTIDYAQINALYKDFVPQKELSAEQKYFPSSLIPSDKNSNATPSIPASMPSESPLIIELDKIKNCFQMLSELIQKNCKRASIFYTSLEEIQLNDFCQDQLKPIVNELQFYFEFFKTLFQRDVKELKDVFESTESELCELEKKNDFLKDQLLVVSLKHVVELSVLLNHECVDNSHHAEIEQLKKKSIEIQEGLQARIKILEKDVQRLANAEKDTLQTSPAKQSRVNSKKNVIALGMYKVITTHESQTNEAKHDLSSTGMKTASSVVQIVLWIVDSGCSKHMTGDRSLLKNFIKKFMGTIRFGNDNFEVIIGYGDYIQGNITICHVYYVEGLRHNLFSAGQFCDGDLEVAFCSKTCYVRNLEGDDLLTGGRESNLYTISISDMAASSPVCLMSKATSTKS
ncbi:hypothetical protein Tco_0122431 [Tanacetum coccineum]